MTPFSRLSSTLLLALVATSTTVLTSTAHAKKGDGRGYGDNRGYGTERSYGKNRKQGGFGYSGYDLGGGYIAIDGSSLNINSPDNNDQINPKGMRFRLGVQMNEVFDIEAHLGGASDSDIDTYDEFSAAYVGLYLKAYQPIGRFSALFAMAGGSSVELTQTINDQQFSDDRSGFSYGFGVETQLGRALDLTADYVRYTLDDDEFSEVSAFNVGLKWHF